AWAVAEEEGRPGRCGAPGRRPAVGDLPAMSTPSPRPARSPQPVPTARPARSPQPVPTAQPTPNPQLLERIRDRLAERGESPTPDKVAAALRAEDSLYGNQTVLALVDALRTDTVGAGPLEALLHAPGVTDVLVNGPDQVFIDRGGGLEPSDVRFPDDDAVRRLAQRLAAASGRRIDDSSPYADVRLPDGTRMHAVLAPLARPGTAL